MNENSHGHELSFAIPQHLLTTNDIPLAVEEQALRGSLRTATSRLCEELAANELEVLQGKISLIKSILSTSRRIPSEIIGEIILHALGFDGIPENRKRTTLDTRRGIWAYAQVCSIWRAAALAIPAAWACIDILLSPFDQPYPFLPPAALHTKPFPFAVETLTTILKRSKSQPLHIRLRFPSDSSDQQKELLKLLVANSSLWETVSLCLTVKHFARLGKIKGRLPLLKSIELAPFSSKKGLQTTSFSKCFHLAPSLRRVKINSFDMKALQLPYHQLTHFVDQRHTSSLIHPEIPNILHLFTNLISVTIDCSVTLEVEVNLPQLRFLYMKWGSSRDELGLFYVPSLETLECGIVHFKSDRLTAMIRRSSRSLKTLSVHDRYLSGSDMVPNTTSFLQLIPGLSSLSFITDLTHVQYFGLELEDNQPFL
ncbi:hypothetical protein C8J56DRAFT_1158538 [Mycena floridula]|nr:hypothetical protein C8J56DRAFT_1158538 [Mycena floridula]